MSKTFTNPGFYHSPYVEFDKEDALTVEENIAAGNTAFVVVYDDTTQWVEISSEGIALCAKIKYKWDAAELESTTFLFPLEFLT